MKWRSWVSRVLAGVAMTVLVALIVFVGVPWLMEPPAAPQPPGVEEIVAEALGPSMLQEEGALEAEDEPEEYGTTAPLVAVRHNGEEMAVVFPAAVGESPGEGRPADDLTVEAQEEAQQVPAEGLPPVLSPEEIAGAMEALEAAAEEEADVLAVAGDTPVPEADVSADTLVARAVERAEAQPSDSERLGGTHGEAIEDWEGDSFYEEVALPPPSATRDVQELLEALGYAPGPVDGIWGERTAGAWRSFARDAQQRAAEAGPGESRSEEVAKAELAQQEPESLGRQEYAQSQSESTAMAELDQSQQREVAGPSVTEMPSPSGGAVDPEGTGAEQAGVPHPRTGLQPREAPEPVVVPQTLRGVMGYRMPLVSRQGVPDQVVSGVLIPAHTTFVILQPGQWELLGLSEEEARLLTEVDRKPALSEPEEESVIEEKAERRRFRLLDVFRRKGRGEAE